MTALPEKVKTFDKDETANAIVELMLNDEYAEMPDTYKAEMLGCSVSQLNKYMTDPQFLNWMGKRLPELYKSKLPQLLKEIMEQALLGKGRQQKMMLEVMGMMDKQKENHTPNITIINTIPDPYQKPKEINAEVIEHESNY